MLLRNICALLVGWSLFVLVVPSFGQAARSPLSAFGVGDLYGPALAHQQQMGGIGISQPQYLYLNNINPALLVFNQYTIFSGGMVGERRTVRGESASEINSNLNINYLAMALPLKPGKWTTAVGLMPYSTVNYRFRYTQPVPGSSATVEVEESGDGGINQLYWAHGVALSRSLSIGFRAAYLFSSINTNYQNQLNLTDQPVRFFPRITETNYVQDFAFTGGLSYRIDSLGRNKRHQLAIGLLYDFQTRANTRYSAILENSNVGGTVSTDSVVTNVRGELLLPASWGVGISFGKMFYWGVAADFTFRDFAQFQNFQGRPTQTQAGWRASLGAEWTPDPTSLGNYLKRMTFRTGVSLEQSPYLINGASARDFGINFGFSLPVSRYSSLDLGARVGRRGTLAENLIQENYFRVYFGVTFNDQWFIKRRFD